MKTAFADRYKELRSKFSKYGAEQLLKSLPNRVGLEKEVIEEILIKRGYYTTNPKKASSKEVPAEVMAAFEKAKLDKKRQVTFHCKALDKLMDGTIVGVRLDPRTNLIQYLIRTSQGVYGKKVGSDNLAFKS